MKIFGVGHDPNEQENNSEHDEVTEEEEVTEQEADAGQEQQRHPYGSNEHTSVPDTTFLLPSHQAQEAGKSSGKSCWSLGSRCLSKPGTPSSCGSSRSGSPPPSDHHSNQGPGSSNSLSKFMWKRKCKNPASRCSGGGQSKTPPAEPESPGLLDRLKHPFGGSKPKEPEPESPGLFERFKHPFGAEQQQEPEPPGILERMGVKSKSGSSTSSDDESQEEEGGFLQRLRPSRSPKKSPKKKDNKKKQKGKKVKKSSKKSTWSLRKPSGAKKSKKDAKKKKSKVDKKKAKKQAKKSPKKNGRKK